MARMEESLIPTTWTTSWSDMNNTGTWRTATPVYQNRLSPCHMACPVNGAIPTWIEQLEKGEFHKAWSALMENNPFPSITGRVCHHPCESFCNRSQYDEKISIKMLERYIGDLALENGWHLSPKGVSQKKEAVAIVGGGPAGLSAAYHLSLKGYRAEIFETHQELGGLMRYGIPSYRLPRNVLDQEIDRLLQVGIKVHTGADVTGAEDYRRLQREYNAVFVATGAQRSRDFPELDDGSGMLLDGLNFLSQVNMNMTPTLGQNVIIVGGGNTAIDAARVAKRLGAGQVTIVYRRTEEQMPCQEIEIIEAKEEGIGFSFLAYPTKIDRGNGAAKLICQKMRLGEKDSSGRPSPEVIEDAYFELKADNVVIAIGTESVIPEIDKIEADSLLHVNKNQETSIKGLFAGGDLTSTERFVSSALGAGKKAAEGIDLFLGGSRVETASDEKAVSYEEVNTFYFPKGTGIENTSLPASERLKNFEEVQLGISDEQALTEAQRCFVCGQCVTCDNCFYYCPDMAISRNGAGDTGYMVLDQYCKGCGLCVKECPRGAIVLREEIR